MAGKKYAKIVRKSKEARQLAKQRLVEWRKQQVVKRIDKPTKPPRAHALGYKAKKGYSIVRVRVPKGGRRRRLYGRKGRKPKKAGLVRFTPGKSLRWIAEERGQKKFPNLEVLNSYYVGEDGKHKWFEIIFVDPRAPAIKRDKSIKWVLKPASRRRVFRGLTAAGKKARGLK